MLNAWPPIPPLYLKCNKGHSNNRFSIRHQCDNQTATRTKNKRRPSQVPKETLRVCTESEIDFFPSSPCVIASPLCNNTANMSVISHLTAWFYHVRLRLCTVKGPQDAFWVTRCAEINESKCHTGKSVFKSQTGSERISISDIWLHIHTQRLSKINVLRAQSRYKTSICSRIKQ